MKIKMLSLGPAMQTWSATYAWNTNMQFPFKYLSIIHGAGAGFLAKKRQT